MPFISMLGNQKKREAFRRDLDDRHDLLVIQKDIL